MGSEDAKVVYADQISVSLVVRGRRGKTGRRKKKAQWISNDSGALMGIRTWEVVKFPKLTN